MVRWMAHTLYYCITPEVSHGLSQKCCIVPQCWILPCPKNPQERRSIYNHLRRPEQDDPGSGIPFPDGFATMINVVILGHRVLRALAN